MHRGRPPPRDLPPRPAGLTENDESRLATDAVACLRGGRVPRRLRRTLRHRSPPRPLSRARRLGLPPRRAPPRGHRHR
ncbi:DUF1826 domain-containing protein [Streptomyces hirsutus]|uniref:DUF1826 domain-containing protein n=1 Tax=Streptomyces hirsutus TaxID=35620 RepID=UPI00369085E7